MYSTGTKAKGCAWRYKSEGYQTVYRAVKQNTARTVLSTSAIRQTPLADWTDQENSSDRTWLEVGTLNWAASG